MCLCCVVKQGELNMAMLEMFIQGLLKDKGTDLYRYKGVLAVKGSNKKVRDDDSVERG